MRDLLFLKKPNLIMYQVVLSKKAYEDFKALRPDAHADIVLELLRMRRQLKGAPLAGEYKKLRVFSKLDYDIIFFKDDTLVYIVRIV